MQYRSVLNEVHNVFYKGIAVISKEISKEANL